MTQNAEPKIVRCPTCYSAVGKDDEKCGGCGVPLPNSGKATVPEDRTFDKSFKETDESKDRTLTFSDVKKARNNRKK